MRIAIILLNWNGITDTLECIESLKKLDYDSYHIIVADNGSSNDSVAILSKLHPDITLIENKKNLGFAEGNNRAIRYALEKGFDALLILNNDTIVDSRLLKAFSQTLLKNPQAILGAKVYLYAEQTTFDHFGGRWNAEKGEFDLVGHREQEDNITWETPFSVDYVCGCSLFASAEAFKKIGLFDARFFLFWEEADFCYRAKSLGYSLLVAPEAKIWHKVSASFVGGKPHVAYFWWRNRLLWIEKHLDKKARKDLYTRLLFPAIFKLMRHHLLLSFQLSTLAFSKKKPQKKKQLQHSKAALYGVSHYALRRFYEGPSWLHKKPS